MQLPTGASRFVFIFAHPAGHVSALRHYSPYFREQGLDWHMVPLDVAPEQLAGMLRTLATSESVVGFNLTMPHKPAAFKLCDAVGPAAQFEGVVNTIRIEPGGRLVGESFDGGRFLVNATSLGLRAKDALPMNPSKLPGDCAVFDIIAARRTEFMQAAAARGLRVLDGLAMIRHQLPLQTAFWRGET
jgi:shikimate 5-dehydrogenase